jgi:hypothetical protein
VDDRERHAEHARAPGFTKQSLLPGTEITVEGFRAKNGANRANGADLILPDGRRLFLGSSGTGAPKERRTDSRKASGFSSGT